MTWSYSTLVTEVKPNAQGILALFLNGVERPLSTIESIRIESTYSPSDIKKIQAQDKFSMSVDLEIVPQTVGVLDLIKHWIAGRRL